MKKNILYSTLFIITVLFTDNHHNGKRDYQNATTQVEETYRLNHENQTLAYVLAQKEKYGKPRKVMAMWQAIELLENFVDASDPDLALGQIHHAMQTAEHMRAHNLPEWLILTGFIHDVGKILYFFDEPQWAVVGDTFPVGCAFSESIVYHHLFENNPDTQNPLFTTKYGIYTPNCGLYNVHMSWGHDEYLYQIVHDCLPEEAAYIIRYHSFYAQHTHHAYEHLLSHRDYTLMKWVELFNRYDLYTKDATPIDVETLKPYYKALVEKYFPYELAW